MPKIQRTLVALLLSALFVSPPAYCRASETESVYWTLLLMPGCMKNVSGFSSRAKDPYEKWRKQHVKEIAELEPHIPEMQDTELRTEQLYKVRRDCEGLLNYIVDDMLAPDARFATPEATWKTLIGALQAGDRSRIAECLSPDSRWTYMNGFEHMTPEQLAEVGGSFTDLQPMKDGGETYQEAVVAKSNGTGGIAVFVRTKRGWLLSQL